MKDIFNTAARPSATFAKAYLPIQSAVARKLKHTLLHWRYVLLCYGMVLLTGITLAYFTTVMEPVASPLLSEQEFTLDSTIFPLDDFRSDANGAPIFSPKSGTRLSLTPIHLAAYCGRDDIVGLLIPCSPIDVYAKNGMMTPLCLALFGGHRGTATLLQAHGANPSCHTSASCLHAAARWGFLAELCYFVQVCGISPDVEDADGATPVVSALYLPEHQAYATIKVLFDLGARADTRVGERSGWAYAGLAAAMGKERLASWLESRIHSSGKDRGSAVPRGLPFGSPS
ncbi:hypothetical protein QQX98_011460 [Neonectria punicea]|uniref:Ankyrin n=1 Tax=Neonectria punicea TaxID=979145 RepID=A0ABR1GLU1_9HYPO